MVKCPLCGSEKIKLVIRNKDMRFGCWGFRKRILECEDCSLQFLYPTWSKESLKKIYKDYNQQKDFSNQKNTSKRITYYLTEYFCEGDFVLEIGCGSGDNVKRLRKKGYNVIGIDKDSSVENSSEGIFNYDIYDKELIDRMSKSDKFDFIYAIHLFEHITTPKTFLSKLKSLLSKNNGEFLLEIPNVEDPLLTIYKSDSFKKFYYVPHHVFFYNPKTMKKLLSKYWGKKFKIRRIQRYGLINHLRWLIFKKPGNINWHIPILDNIYNFVLVYLFRKSDTMIVRGER